MLDARPGHGFNLASVTSRRRLGPLRRATAAGLLACALPVLAAAQETFPPPENPPVLEAQRATGAIILDGRLDEADWRGAPVASGFRVVEPQQGAPAPLDTEVRILFDDEYLYVGAYLHDPEGIQGPRVRGLTRDFSWFANDAFGITLDPFGDARIGMAFQVNAAGVQRDQLIFDGTAYQLEWDGVWQAAVADAEGGWSVEMAIPWRTLRYSADGGAVEGFRASSTWVVNFVRTRRGAGEMTGWSLWPRAFGPYRMEYGGHLVGLEPPPAGRNLQLHPYALGGRTDPAFPPAQAGSKREVGLDVKWSLDPRTVMDLTLNTDFAQVEDDRQVVNLSRAAVLFPERRPFFLENAGVFQVGESRIIHPFFSRRMGLDDTGRAVPILGGARLTTRREGGSAGALVLQQGGRHGAPSSTFGVVRGNRNLGRDSRAGAYVGMRRDEAGAHGSWSATGAVDGLWRTSSSTQFVGFASGSWHQDGGASGLGVYVWGSTTKNWGYLGWLQNYVGPEYDPSIGFTARRNFILTSPAVRFDYRPHWRPRQVRNFDLAATAFFYHRATDGEFEQGQITLGPAVTFLSGTKITLSTEPVWQNHDRPFRPLPGVEITPGRYRYTRWTGSLDWAPSARLSGTAQGATGDFYDGRLHRAAVGLRAVVSPHLILAGDYSLDALRGVGGGTKPDLNAQLLGSEVRLSWNPRLHLSLFQQWNSARDTHAWNARLSWEFRPLSHLYVVYNDREAPAPPGGVAGVANSRVDRPQRLQDRQFVVKMSWLLGL